MDLSTKFEGSYPQSEITGNDSVPSNIDPSTISMTREFLSVPLAQFLSNLRTSANFPDNNMCVSVDTANVSSNEEEWMTVETVLIRILARRAPSGHFPVYFEKAGFEKVGYDAAVCAHKYEPWIVEAYNTSIGAPSILRIVGKASAGTPLSPSGNIRGAPISNTRYLNATKKGKGNVFVSAIGTGIHQIVKDESLASYFPTPVVSFIVPSCTTFLPTSTYSTGHFFHRWCWAYGIHRTLSRPACRHPGTGRCG